MLTKDTLRDMAEIEAGDGAHASPDEIEVELRADNLTALMATPPGPTPQSAKNPRRPRNGPYDLEDSL